MNEVDKQITEGLGRAPTAAINKQTKKDEYVGRSPFGQYLLTETGVFLKRWGSDKSDDVPIRVTNQPLRVLALGRTSNYQRYSVFIEWEDMDRNKHQEILAMADLEGEAKDVRKLLADGGLQLLPKRGNTDYLIDYLRSCTPSARFVLVDRLGWHENKENGYFFALKNKVIGRSKELIKFNSEAPDEALPALSIKGTSQDWINNISKYALYSTRATCAICCALAAPLIRLLNLDTFGLHFVGKTSRGKSTLAEFAASVFGDFSKYKKSWQGTQTGMEGLAYNHNDLLLILDEISTMEPRDLSNVIYALGNGVDKNRGAKNGLNRTTKTWRELILSTGEEGVADILRKANLKAQAGLEVRLSPVRAQATENDDLGVNETFPPGLDAITFKRLIDENSRLYHGAIFEDWLNYLIGLDTEWLKEEFESYREKFINDYKPTNQNKRIASNFALLAFAGELATGAGLTGWERESDSDGDTWARDAVGKCFLSTLDLVGNGMPIENKRALEHIEALLKERAANFKGLWQEGGGTPLEFWGFIKPMPDEAQTYYIFPPIFEKYFCVVMGAKDTARTLLKYGLLEVAERNRLRKRERIPNGPLEYFYAVKRFSTDEIIESILKEIQETDGA